MPWRPPLILLAVLAAASAWRLARAMRHRHPRRAEWAPFAIGGALVLAAVPLGAIAARADAVAAMLVCDDAPLSADAVFVASGDVDFHRTRHAAEVFRRTSARWFVLSGAGVGGDSGELMAEAAASFGVPSSAIVVEGRATSTRENVALSRAMLDSLGVRTVAVVTDPLHSRRLAMAARRAWPGKRVVSATVSAPEPFACSAKSWREEARCRRSVAEEWKKLAGYFLLGWI